jgi:hypothetical protein
LSVLPQGTILTTPESGWRRISTKDDTTVVFAGTWTVFRDYTTNVNGIQRVDFTGTKLRLIDTVPSASYCTQHNFYLDGIKYLANSTGYNASPVVVFDIQGLEDKEHSLLILTDLTGGSLRGGIGWLDIDEHASLYTYNDDYYYKNPDKVKQFSSSLNPGDGIPCRYTSSVSGKLGSFSEFGTCVASNILPAATTDGRFYWVFVGYDSQDRMKFIADRGLQIGVSSDEINNIGRQSGFGAPINLMYNNVALGKSVSADQTPYLTYTVDKCVDGIVTSSDGFLCETSSLISRVSIDLGESQFIDGVRLTNLQVSSVYRCKDYDIEISENGVDWKIVYSGTLLQQSKAQYISINETSRYWSVVIKNYYSSGSYSTGIGEIELLQLDPRYATTVRLMTGGSTFTGSEVDNEWDQIIVNDFLGNYELWNWSKTYTITSSSTAASTRLARGYSSVSNRMGTSSTNVSGFYGYRPVLLVETIKALPKINISIDRVSFFDKPILITGNISIEDNVPVEYRILINNFIYEDWTLYSTDLYKLIKLNSSSQIKIEARTDIYPEAEKTFYVWKKSEITHVSLDEPDVNYVENQNILNSNNTLLFTCPLDASSGYLLNAKLTINLKSGTLGNLRLGLIKSYWDLTTVTYNTHPNYDNASIIVTPTSFGSYEIDITELITQLYSFPNYGIYVSSDTSDVVISLEGNVYSFNYLPTLLNPPIIIHGNSCPITWKPIIFSDLDNIYNYELWRATNLLFDDEIMIMQTNLLDKLSYTDNSVSFGTYYYRLKFKLNDNETKIPVNSVYAPVPESGYRNVLTDPINIIYTLELSEGLSFDDVSVDYNFYTTPDRIVMRSLDMGTMIGGRTQSIFGVEIINSYDSIGFEVTLRGVTLDGLIAEEFETYGRLYDNLDEIGRTKLELSLTGGVFMPQYPLTFTLNAGQRQIIYIRITPSIYGTIGAKQFQLKLNGRPL